MEHFEAPNCDNFGIIDAERFLNKVYKLFIDFCVEDSKKIRVFTGSLKVFPIIAEHCFRITFHHVNINSKHDFAN